MTRFLTTAATAALAASALTTAAFASGPTVPVEPYVAPAPIVPMAYDWTGGYVGLRVGTPLGSNNWEERSTPPEASTPGDWEGTSWGISGGYDVQRGALVFGAAIDYNGGEIQADSTPTVGFGCVGGFCETHVENSLAIRGRVGRAFDRTLVFATAGFASGEAFAQNPGGPALGSDRLNGWTAGLGVEHALTDSFSLSLEYLYTDLGRLEIPASCGTDCYTDVNYGTVRLGANFRF